MGKIIKVSFNKIGASSGSGTGCATCGAKASANKVTASAAAEQMKKLAPQPKPEPQAQIETQPEPKPETTDQKQNAIAGIALDVWSSSTAAKIARMAKREAFEEYVLTNGILENELISKLKEVEIVKAIKSHHNI
jgi:hypothetical protein